MSLIDRNESTPVRTQRTAQYDTFFKYRREDCAGRSQVESNLNDQSTGQQTQSSYAPSAIAALSQLSNHERRCGKQKIKVACNQCRKTMLKTSLKNYREKNCHG